MLCCFPCLLGQTIAFVLVGEQVVKFAWLPAFALRLLNLLKGSCGLLGHHPTVGVLYVVPVAGRI